MKEPIKNKLNIFLIEDNPGDMYLISESLKKSKLFYQLFMGTDGSEAIELFQQCKASKYPKPDLIILDLNLPRIDGREVLSIINNDLYLNKIPIIILSTSLYNPDLIQVDHSQRILYIQKPYHLKEYESFIQKIESFCRSM